MYKNLIRICTMALFFSTAIVHADPFYDAFNVTYNKNIFARQIQDLRAIPQNSSALTSNFTNAAKPSFADYFQKYFAPWTKEPDFDLNSLQELLTKRPIRYQENYKLVPEEFFENLQQNANLKAFGTLKQKAIILRNTNLRVLPTNAMLFGDIYAAGEGYPFDYAQDDYLKIGEPACISHYTKDGKYAYIKTSSGANGFVLSEDIAPVSSELIKKFQNNLVMLTSNNLVYLPTMNKATPTMQLYMGTVLPLADAKSVYIPMLDANAKVNLLLLKLDSVNYIEKPLAFTKQNVSFLVNQFISQPYGWGGNLFHMDCARLVRNYFAVFGIHMPLLSKDQGKQGMVFDLSNMTAQEKLQTIQTKAIPYQSIIYMPGHIGIYMGQYKTMPIMLHATWGVKLFDQNNTEFRFVIGQTVLSTLSPGQELPGFSEKSNLLLRIAAVANL